MKTIFPHVDFSPAMREAKIAIVIPCYNEAARFDADAFVQFSRDFPNISFLFVNDGSRDATDKVLRAAAARLPENLEALSLPQNGGKAEAVRQGVLHLLKKTGYRYVGYFDADLATPLEEIPFMLDYQRYHAPAKMIFGSRIARGGANIHRNWARHYISRFLVTFREFFFPFNIYDTQCGAKLIDSSVAPALFAQPFMSRWLFDVELLARLRLLEPTVDIWQLALEVPLRIWVEKGESKVTIKNCLMVPYELTRIGLYYRRLISAATKIEI